MACLSSFVFEGWLGVGMEGDSPTISSSNNPCGVWWSLVEEKICDFLGENCMEFFLEVHFLLLTRGLKCTFCSSLGA